MKYLETSFHDYIDSFKDYNLHPKYNNLHKKLPNDLENLNNIIIYGPKGIGKYTQSLKIISKYSNNKLHYDKKIQINYNNKQTYLLKLSDIHFEVDFELLGCNARLLWNDIFTQIVDIINSKQIKKGIILCKNFHCIHSELLEIFYSYMQQENASITLKYIIITEHISFLPSNVIDMCTLLYYKRPSYLNYKKCIMLDNEYNKKNDNNTNADANADTNANILKNKNYDLSSIKNIKDLKTKNTVLINDYKYCCDLIIENIIDYKNINFIELRENLYKLLIYQLDIYECIYYIFSSIIRKFHFSNNDIFEMNIKIYEILKYYNNNYRPITHLEKFSLYLCSMLMKNGY